MNPLGAAVAGVAALAAIAATTTGAHAVTSLGMFVHDYGSGDGKVDPGGNDQLSDDFVTVSTRTNGAFNDSFDLSGLFSTLDPGFSIDRFELKLTFSDANDTTFGIPSESWFVTVSGSRSAGVAIGDFTDRLDPTPSPQTFVLSSSDDFPGGVDAFATTLLNEKFEFSFFDDIALGGSFDLDQAELEVFGTLTVIPTPLALPMFASAFGVAALVRRRAHKKVE